jgi:ADP-heptose:LPS heptosyltransferase
LKHKAFPLYNVIIMQTKKFKKVLLIKLCCIGDIIQATPAMRAVAATNAEIHYLCIDWVKDLVDMIPFVSKKFVINTSNITSVISTIAALRKEKYDLVINFHRDTKSYVFSALLGAKHRAGFDWKGQGWFLNSRFNFDSCMHESLRYLSIVIGLGYEPRGEETEIKVPASHGRYEIKGKKKIGLFPGGGKNPGTTMTTKRWPIESFTELAGKLQTSGYTVHFIGGELDRDVLANAELRIKNAEFIITKDLKELAGVLSSMDVVVAGDTGPLHMAAALGVKTIGLFGPTSAALVGPRNGKNINIWKKIECAPCYEPGTVHYGEYLKCTDNRCMKEISVGEVADAIEKLFNIDH